MKTIHKYSLSLKDVREIIKFSMPIGAKVVHIGNQNESLCLWAIITIEPHSLKESDEPNKKEYRPFLVTTTGYPLDPNFPKYLGTVSFADGGLVLHVFEKE